ncbi:MAG: DNA primase [Ruminococcaceae bacterium]|nr:DNA primase [Oscillospiraceae bacterium]
MAIEQAVIEEIKFRNNIEDVISQYVTLKRAGSNMVGLCPFHSEKSPSFTVFNGEGNFYCFGCGAGGDVITFVRKAENLDYRGALEFLAKRVGITISESSQDKKESMRRERTLEMNKIAARFFHEKLMSDEGREGYEYLTKKRGLSNSHIRHFGLGFAPNSFGALTELLRSKGYKDHEMASAFLCGVSQKTGRPYDYFRNRVIFPILSTSGDVIAFGGRVMDDSKPKYLNSSDTPAFKKSRNLFAMNFAKNYCSEQIILCEGYMDVIALHCAGFMNSVATLGTAITPEHARMLKRYTKKVIISYDSDEAGQNAADKAFKLLGEVGVETKILRMSGAKDPDEYIKKFGSESFRKIVEDSETEFDYKFGKIMRKYNFSVTADKVKALDECEKLIAQTSSAAEREIYLYQVAPKFGIAPDAMKRDVERIISQRRKNAAKDETRKIMTSSEGYGDRVNPDFVKNPKAATAENAIIGLLLMHPEYVRELENKGDPITADEMFTSLGKKIVGAILEIVDKDVTDSSALQGALGEYLELEEVERAAKLRVSRRALTNNTISVVYECRKTLGESKDRAELGIDDIIQKKREQAKNGK